MENLVHKVRRPDRWDQPYGNPVSDDEVLRVYQYEPFSLINPKHFPSNRPFEQIIQNDGRIRHIKAGEVITMQGDASNSCYLLMDGKLRIILLKKDSPKAITNTAKNWLRKFFGLLNSPVAPMTNHSRRVQDKNNFWKSLKQLWTNHSIQEYRNPDTYELRHNRRINDQGHAVRVIDNIEETISTSKTQVMNSGEFFGEVAALSRSTRIASIFAETDATLFELRWQGLRDIRLWDQAFRKWVDNLFHQRSFLPLFTKNPLLASLNEYELEHVEKASRFQTYGDQSWYKSTGKMGQQTKNNESQKKVLIVGEGQHLDGLLLIRGGFAQVTKSYGDGEGTVGYLVSNELYGVGSVIAHFEDPSIPITSSYNLYALGYVDLLVIPTDTVLQYLLPSWNKSQALKDKDLLKMAAPMCTNQGLDSQLPQALLETLFEQRLINGSATMVINNNACIGCDECVKACANAHDNNPRFIRHGPNFSHFTFANACMHCIDPVCLSDCPTGAIHRPSEHSIVEINDVACIGCGNCANSCPYDNIRMVEIRDEKNQPLIDQNTQKPLIKATKCDLCSQQSTGPACEQACPHDALKRLNFSNRDEVWQWFSERY